MNRMSLSSVRRRILLGLTAVLFGSAVHAAGYPERPITLIIPYAAGGGTDAVGRVLASQMEKTLGQPVNVVNRTGGNGVVGLTAASAAAADGYTLGLITVEATMLHGLGLTDIRQSSLTPIALVNADPASVLVAADSPFKTVDDLVAAAKANPGKLKGSGAAPGGIWHLALAGMLKGSGADPLSIAWIPSNGAAPALQDLVAGGIHVVTCSLPEARSLIDAKKIRPLAVMATDRSPLFPTVPTLLEVKKIDWLALNWRGIVAPKGLPADIQERLYRAVKQAVESKEYRDFLQTRGFGAAFATSADFAKLMATSEAELIAVAKASGLTK